MNLVTVTFRQVTYTHVGVDLDAGIVYGEPEIETDVSEAWEVRDENGLRCDPAEAIQAIPLAHTAAPDVTETRTVEEGS